MAVEETDLDLPPEAPAAKAEEKPAAKAPETPAADAEEPQFRTAILQGLNKVTGHISRLEAPVGTVMRFDKLEIVARRCWKSPPEDRPENAALLDIAELKSGEMPQRIFLGWMFSSSPGLSGLEHPVYDITVLSCDESKEPESPADKPGKKTAEEEKPKTEDKAPAKNAKDEQKPAAIRKSD